MTGRVYAAGQYDFNINMQFVDSKSPFVKQTNMCIGG